MFAYMAGLNIKLMQICVYGKQLFRAEGMLIAHSQNSV